MRQETVANESSIRKDQATSARLLDNANDAYQTHIKLEDEFQQTLGLARALEACADDPDAVRKIIRLIRADYRRIKKAFAEIETRNDIRSRAFDREFGRCH